MISTDYVWLNDSLLPAPEARVSVHDRGFLYGDGFFETLRAENGRPWFLTEHLNRLEASAQAFRIPIPQGIDWQARLHRLLEANGLVQRLAAVKILLSRGEAAGLGLPADSRPTLVISARPYEPPGPEEYDQGWPLLTFPEGRTTFVGRHKSLNYLFYLAARQHALDRGAREALILESDGSVSEGSATSIIYAKEGRYFTPQARSALAGVTLAVLARALALRGLKLESRPTQPADLKEADGLWLANSLMGLMPVASLDGKPVKVSAEATQFLQDCLQSEAGEGLG
jgi:branched-chain amino acid aminotransferase/para-aminobenzoate synthetase component 1